MFQATPRRMHLATILDTPAKRAVAACLLAFALWLPTVVFFSGALQTFEELSGDWIWRMAATDNRERRIVLVDIDESSLQHLGPWPWPRQRLAELSDRLADEGASLQIFDIIFPLPAQGDAQLLASLKKNNGILAQVFALEGNTQAASGQPTAALPWAACPPSLPQAKGYIANQPGFSQLPVGHITPLVENDGIIRRQPAIVCADNKAYPALFIAALGQALASPQVRLDKGSGLLAPPWELTGPSLQENGLPLDAQGNVRIPWSLSPAGFISLSAADILAGRVPQGVLHNAWVLIGSTALGLNDRIATPYGGSGAGLIVHAQLLRGAIDGKLPATPRFGPLYTLLATLLGALCLAALGRLPKKPVLTLAIAALALAGALWLLKALLLLRYALWLEWGASAFYLVLFALCLGLIEYARSRLERDRLYTHLASYLPGPVAAILARQDPSDAIDATRRNITALYADIRNFSGYCETHLPEAATAVLHAFFSMVTEKVELHGGLVESFQGDAVLAVWGSGQGGPEPERALQAAHDILQASRELLPRPGPEDIAPLALGIGLETGIATVGSFGLARRRTHLAIGHTVTTAARLQEMTVELAYPILVGEGMAASIGTQHLESQGTFLLDGLKAPCHIYAYPLDTCDQ